jgi:hypothetical protein
MISSTVSNGTPMSGETQPQPKTVKKTTRAGLLSSLRGRENAFCFQDGGAIHPRYNDVLTLTPEKALRCGHFPVVKRLHLRGHTFNATDFDCATRHGHFVVVKYLLKRTANLCSYRTLDNAACNGHVSIVKLLIDRYPCTRNTMNKVIENGHFSVFKLLVEHDYTMYFETINNAVKAGHCSMVKLLIEHGYICSASAINIASKSGYIDIVRLLLECGHDYTNKTIELADRKGYQCIVELLNKYPELHV